MTSIIRIIVLGITITMPFLDTFECGALISRPFTQAGRNSQSFTQAGTSSQPPTQAGKNQPTYAVVLNPTSSEEEQQNKPPTILAVEMPRSASLPSRTADRQPSQPVENQQPRPQYISNPNRGTMVIADNPPSPNRFVTVIAPRTASTQREGFSVSGNFRGTSGVIRRPDQYGVDNGTYTRSVTGNAPSSRSSSSSGEASSSRNKQKIGDMKLKEPNRYDPSKEN